MLQYGSEAPKRTPTQAEEASPCLCRYGLSGKVMITNEREFFASRITPAMLQDTPAGILGLYWGYMGDNGKENGNYYNGLYGCLLMHFRVCGALLV